MRPQGSRPGRARSTGEHLATGLSWRPDRRPVAERLSGGTRQKLNLVLGELHAPDLLLLDEPYQGFDQGSYLDFWQQVYAWRDAGKGVVVVPTCSTSSTGSTTSSTSAPGTRDEPARAGPCGSSPG